MKTIEQKSKLELNLNGDIIHMLPPKMKVIRKMKESHETANEGEILETIAEALSNNIESKEITADIFDELDIEDFKGLMSDFNGFIADIQKN
jgi:hypothetical protein